MNNFQILAKDDRPLYRCSSKGNLVREDYNINQVVTDILKDVDTNVKRISSPVDFFGLLDISVLSQVCVTIQI